jgi:hypothetical protein
MARKRNIPKRQNMTQGGRVRLHTGANRGHTWSESQARWLPHAPHTNTTNGGATEEETDPTKWAPGGQGSGMYADLTADQSTAIREDVQEAQQGIVTPYAKHVAAKANVVNMNDMTYQMADVGDAQATQASAGPEEQVSTATTTQAQEQDPTQAASMQVSTVSDSPDIDAKTGELSPEAVAQLQDQTLSLAAEGATIDQQQITDALAGTIVGSISSDAKASAAKVAGTNLPRMLRAKKQLRSAGLSEEDINLIGNDPDSLENELVNYTEAERGMIAGLPEEALVSHQLNSLLQGMESGEIPVFARPAVAAVNNMLADRGLDASTVGRDALFNAIIQSAVPLAQSNAQSIKESVINQRGIEAQAAQMDAQMAQQTALQNAQTTFSMDMANLNNAQQTALSNSKFLQTVSLTDANMEQQAVLQNASAMASLDMANLDSNTKLAAQNAQAFLQMDMQNLSNEQQGVVLKGQMEQQRLLTNQAAENASRQFNASNRQQTNNFMAQLAQQVELTNAQSANAMATFNATQENAAEARRAGITADINKYNAQMVTQINQYNNQMDFNREQWNKTNSQAVSQSNIQWRRQANLVNTAAQNEVNMRNAMQAYQLSTQAMGFLWQEMRDQATFDNKWVDNEETRKVQLLATAIANEGEAADNWGTNLSTITNIIDQVFGS